MVSKPVLGQSGAPYNCTISGQVSGNLSHPGDANCSELGFSREHWILNEWLTFPAVKGDLPNNGCQFNDAEKGTLFNGFGSGLSGLPSGGLAAAFFYAPGGGCNVTTSGTVATQASLYQVLASTATGEVFDLGRATVVSLLNYYANPSIYPVTAHTIIAMFNATYAGGSYLVNGTQYWTRAQVVMYETSLYPPPG